ncbi:NAD(P)/FAD-dependent oxidoreductase [Pseudomonas sp. Teo4]|uniref:NAD(P)/FAD-dependent oxidoreductase n=1 Tax=Pseudomonas sp. Teo4 TaxID=3064528 RepID=UPI002ACB0987|nr:NAD(P)/FAD-dependent oxidoreductase [Pseudomonas sp. Teo4]
MKHRVLIVGGGAGGIELATRLGKVLGKRKKATITLVDANLTHIWKPLLHEVAAGSLDPSVDEVNYFAQAKWNYFSFQYGRMVGLDRVRKVVMLKSTGGDLREVPYDTLVMAVGSQCNDFGTVGVQEHCQFLDSRIQAEKLQKQLLARYMRAHAEDASNPLRIAIVGAGATGVELCAELQHAVRVIEGYGLRHASPDILQVTLVEAGPRILPVLNQDVSETVHSGLAQLGIDVRVNTAVKEVKADGVVLADGGAIASDMTIWAAGIKAPAFLKELSGLETNRINQLLVRRTLQTTEDDSIFAIGDCASCPLSDEGAGTVPPRAQAAHQQAEMLSRSLALRIAGKSLLKFRYEDRGTLISMASFNAVGTLTGLLGRKKLTKGLFARMLYMSLYRLHQVALFGAPRMLLKAFSELLQRKTRPRLKLH